MASTTRDEVRAAPAAREPRPLLLAGQVAGPAYVVIGALEAALRDGFDVTRHSLSLLANGSWGWVHSAMMVGTGLLTVAGAAGLRRAPTVVPRWAAWGVGLFGLGIAVAGLLRADPMDGFPPGTPDGPPESVTWHGIGHLAAGGVGFLGLIAACVVVARWSSRQGRRGFAGFSLLTGVYYLVSFLGIASGAGNRAVNLAFCAAVGLGWLWITLLLRRAAYAGGMP